MTSKIRVLNDHTINKIAAGEVIEHPASVVKELVENALDAGSTEICIEIKVGGRQLIRISDNGSGMNSDDALLCLERHATSKIKSLEDIYDLNTMGFRGEALPSIASISKFTILTCTQESSEGTMVIVDGGRILQCSPAARAPGTTIEVKSLFFNVPVRKKFQKSPIHDTNEILKVVNLLALGHPHVKFQLINNQMTTLSANIPQGETFHLKLGERISTVLGKDFFSEMSPLETSHGNYSIRGFIGNTSNHRQNRTGQYLFINHRGVSSPLISFSIREGYGTTLPSNRHPVYVLHLTIPGDLVDVNIHPQKKEVKLRQEQFLKEILIQAIESSLRRTQTNIPHASPSFFIPGPSVPFDVNFRADDLEKENTHSFFKQPLNRTSDPFPHSYDMYFADEKNSEQGEQQFIPSPIKDNKSQQTFPIDSKKTIPKVLTTIKRYILLDARTTNLEDIISLRGSSDGMYLVDQRAAHSRIIYERLLYGSVSMLPLQSLLIPYTLELTSEESSIMREYLKEFNEMGIHVHECGPQTFLIDAIPQFLANKDIISLIKTIMHDLSEFNDTKTLKKEKDKKFMILANRTAISDNELLQIYEAQTLIDQLMQCKISHQCPYGKPIFLHISLEALAKQFQK
jgi:DNA mismatch repair protein MutL